MYLHLIFRNKVKTKEERMCRIRKKVEALKKKSGVVKKKDIIAKNSRNLTKAIKLLAPKRGEFKVDAWENGEGNIAYICLTIL